MGRGVAAPTLGREAGQRGGGGAWGRGGWGLGRLCRGMLGDEKGGLWREGGSGGAGLAGEVGGVAAIWAVVG